MSKGTLIALRALRERLGEIPSYPWDGVEAWVSSARPLFRAELSEHLRDFENETQALSWSGAILVGGLDRYGNSTSNAASATSRAEATNKSRAEMRRVRILSFLDGLLSLLERAESTTKSAGGLERVITLVNAFERICRSLARRPHGGSPLVMKNEYDVQYLFGALLKGLLEDSVAEEQTPSFGGSGARMDFLIKSERLVVELKMTRDNLSDKEVTDQLLIDIGRYGAHPDCGTLVFFVYDPKFRLKNPRRIETDLTKSHGDINVHVFVRPL